MITFNGDKRNHIKSVIYGINQILGIVLYFLFAQEMICNLKTMEEEISMRVVPI